VPGWLGRMLGREAPCSEGASRVVSASGSRAEPRAPTMERRSAPSGAVPRPKLARVLVLDDDPQVAMGIRRLLYRHDVTIAHSGAEAIDILRNESFDVVVSDVMMPEPSGLDVYDMLADEGSPLVQRFVFVTGGHWCPRAREFLSRVKNPRLDKPVDPAALDGAIARVLRSLPAQGGESAVIEAG
jgi:CheY-like chemotaxis protein